VKCEQPTEHANLCRQWPLSLGKHLKCKGVMTLSGVESKAHFTTL